MANVIAQDAAPSTPDHLAVSASAAPEGPPVMPASTGAEADAWRGPLRHFHLTGERAGLPATTTSEFEPVLLSALLEPQSLLEGWPLFLPDTAPNGADSGPARLASLLEQQVTAAGGGLSAIGAELPRLVRAFGRALDELTEIVTLADVIDEVFAAFGAEFELSRPGREALDAELARLKANLPQTGLLLGMGPHSLGALHAWSLRRERVKRSAAFVDELRVLRGRLADVVKVDDGHSDRGRAADALSSRVGEVGDAFIDASALAGLLPTHRGSVRLSDARRARIEETLATLDRYLADAVDIDDLVLVHRDALPEGWEATGARTEQVEDVLGGAAAVFDKLVDRMVSVFKAMRIARLEVAGDYDPDLHDQTLGRFCWQSLSAEEMLLVPTVVAVETVSRLENEAAGALAGLLRSGRPVQILALDGTTSAPEGDSRRHTTGFATGLGYQTIAQRGAFVLQSTLARPTHLASGLARMARSLRPAVAVVATPDWQGPWPWLDLAAGHEGRATPCFLYDPGAGETMADRFELTDNPQPESAWPTHVAPIVDAEGNATGLELPFTFGEAAATDRRWSAHICVLPAAAWSDEQEPLADALEAAGDDAPLSVPYLWVGTAEGLLARAVVTRELAFAARDRRQMWRLLQELAGVDNAWADLAAETARAEAEASAAATLAATVAAHAAELDAVRQAATGEAMDRLVGVLLNLETALPAAAPVARPAAAPAAPAAAEAPAEAAPAAAPVEEPAEDDVSFDDPFVDTAMCTSCDECVGVNPELFKYDGNKQAFITDRSKGTFKQLVQAAQKCPARCIHPGAPADGDSTATDELLAIAAKFN